jgi:hypothetical protein
MECRSLGLVRVDEFVSAGGVAVAPFRPSRVAEPVQMLV